MTQRKPAIARPPSRWTEPARRLRHFNRLVWTTHSRLNQQRHTLRVHVFLITLLTLCGLWAASALLMHAGVESLALRYALAVPLGYAVYLGLLRLWAHRLARDRELPDPAQALDGLDGAADALPGFDSGGGGDFGGGGASDSWSPDLGEGLARAADGAGNALGGFDIDLDEGALFVVPLIVLLGLFALLAGLLGTGVFMLFGVDVLVAVTVEVALASLAGSWAYKGVTEGWLSSALRHTGRGFIAAWVLSVLLGAGIDHWLPQAQSLPQVVRHLRTPG